tara:strand:- start:2587 stop:3009 length:423 start_codon:yes stop_codon:yes gene_type:complete
MKRYFFIFSFLSFIYAEDKSDLIIEIEKSLMATCFHGTVYEHGNQEMEKEISSFVEAGKDKDYIINYYTNKYGERILAMPSAKGFNLFAWLAPLIICAVGGLIIFAYFRTPIASIADISLENEKDIKFNDEIEAELKELD